jgi:hypothetical protein
MMRAYSKVHPVDETQPAAAGVVVSNMARVCDAKPLSDEWMTKGHALPTPTTDNEAAPGDFCDEIVDDADDYDFALPSKRLGSKATDKGDPKKPSVAASGRVAMTKDEYSALQAWLQLLDAPKTDPSMSLLKSPHGFPHGVVNFKRFKKVSIVGSRPSPPVTVDLKIDTNSPMSQLHGHPLKPSPSVIDRDLEDLRELDNVIMLDSQRTMDLEAPKKKVKAAAKPVVKLSQSPVWAKRGQGKKK